jgi:hypothetical protein
MVIKWKIVGTASCDEKNDYRPKTEVSAVKVYRHGLPWSVLTGSGLKVIWRIQPIRLADAIQEFMSGFLTGGRRWFFTSALVGIEILTALFLVQMILSAM